MVVHDERGMGRAIKAKLPWRRLTAIYNRIMRHVPFGWKYGWGFQLRRGCAPYRLLNPTDTVVQIGNARDILWSGRNRAVHFSRCVPRGRVIAIEADRASYDALCDVVRQHDLSNIDVVYSGAWSSKTTLIFYSSPKHPAANLIFDVKESQGVTEEIVKLREYQKHTIEVDTVDNILRSLSASTPALVSITTNGAELPILEGLAETMERGCKYISLAETGDGLAERMLNLGYEYIARDDRGYCFRKIRHAGEAAA